ncbi:MAG: FAD-dependent oxidoreductase [Alphaproteobacteria bacterium]|nr:FAD-dependent oxidoreductase [Alphaproteobacteria bacterium]
MTTIDTKLTFRRFENGDSMWNWDDLHSKIFEQDTSYKCPTYIHRTPPCQSGCPSGHDVRGWLAIARGMDKSPNEGEAWQAYAFHRMIEANPFPSMMGRVCPAPCQKSCNRNDVDDYVGINALEHYVGDWAIENKLPLPEVPALSGKHVAVIGGGPAGLAAAWFLRLKGHAVTIFEEKDKLGGMMRYGIPGYRTPRDMLDAEIGRVLALDSVSARTGVRVGRDISMAELEHDFDAIFWGIGAQSGRGLPLPGADAPNCISGVTFLDAFNRGQLTSTEKRILVIGGGDTSIDVACVARRIGHIDAQGKHSPSNVDVVLSSLFELEKMTAAQPEREDAIREGVDIQAGVMPLEFIKDAEGRIRKARLTRCEMKGSAPHPIEGTEYEIDVDLVVLAIGQSADLAEGLSALDNGKGSIAVDSTLKVKGTSKHFAGGDAIRPHLLTTAIGNARVAAISIDHFLDGIID